MTWRSTSTTQAPPAARAATAARPARVMVEDVAPGIWYITGEGHHSVLAEFVDHLTLVEAPSQRYGHSP
jgi:hypothetical protein